MIADCRLPEELDGETHVRRAHAKFFISTTINRQSSIGNISRSGFTLLEILVVVLIITILATLVGINVAKEPGKAKVAVTRAQIVNMRTALQHYRMEQGGYPTQEQGLEALCRVPDIAPVPDDYPAEGYLESRNLPRDAWGNPYVYLVPGAEGQPFEIISYGADGQPGGDGDKAEISSAAL